MSKRTDRDKIIRMAAFGLGMVILGYAMDPVTPIIKRICTSSFVIVSGGWAILALALFYWVVDVKKKVSWASFAMIVGMNSIFIYMVANTIGGDTINKTAAIFTTGFLSWAAPPVVKLLSALLSLAGYWYLCYWLYKKRIFIKI
jgi:predicted acyltransferase